jgi:hypothetical protein
MSTTLQEVIDSVYDRSRDRSLTTEQYFCQVMSDLRYAPSPSARDTMLDVLREYKRTGKHLEETAKKIHSVVSADDVLENPFPDSSLPDITGILGSLGGGLGKGYVPFGPIEAARIRLFHIAWFDEE